MLLSRSMARRSSQQKKRGINTAYNFLRYQHSLEFKLLSSKQVQYKSNKIKMVSFSSADPKATQTASCFIGLIISLFMLIYLGLLGWLLWFGLWLRSWLGLWSWLWLWFGRLLVLGDDLTRSTFILSSPFTKYSKSRFMIV